MNMMETRANRAFWTECERQLFSLAAMEGETYQQILRAIRAVSDQLRDISSVQELEAAWENADQYFQKAAESGAFAVHILPKEKIAGAAFALREREVIAEVQQIKKTTALKAALDDGKTWAILDESGDLQHGLLSPYRCTEVHLKSGLAVVSMTQADPANGATLRTLSVVRLDPANGSLVDAEPGISDWTEFDSIEAFTEERKKLRELVEELNT